MGLVFLALLAFLLIMVVLQRLFPEDGAPLEELGSGGGEEAVEDTALTEPTVPPQAESGPGQEGRLPGAQIAAMAVAMYLSMEQEESGGQGEGEVAVTTPASMPVLPSGVSNWSLSGRTALMEGQSRRPPPYGQKLSSAYSQKDGPS